MYKCTIRGIELRTGKQFFVEWGVRQQGLDIIVSIAWLTDAINIVSWLVFSSSLYTFSIFINKDGSLLTFTSYFFFQIKSLTTLVSPLPTFPHLLAYYHHKLINLYHLIYHFLHFSFKIWFHGICKICVRAWALACCVSCHMTRTFFSLEKKKKTP